MSTELAIIIDCWETNDGDEVNLLSYNIRNFITLRKEIKYVVLASYDVYYRDDDNTIWRSNYDKLFYNDAFLTTRYLYNLANSNRQLVEYNKNVVLEKTEPLLLNTVFENKFQISLRHFFELDYLLKQDNTIDTIWILGSGWERCARYRELGWEYMKALTGKTVLTISSCIDPFLYKVDTDSNWEPTDLGEFIYRHK